MASNGTNGNGTHAKTARRGTGKLLHPLNGKELKPVVPMEGVPVGTLVEQNHGGALRVGNPGNKGGGRPPDAFRKLCRELASMDKGVVHLIKILKNPDHAQYMAARRYVTEYGYGRPVQPVELGLEDTLAALLTREPPDPANR